MNSNRNRGVRNVRHSGIQKAYWRENHRFADLFNAVLFDGHAFFRPEDLEDVEEDIEADASPPAHGGIPVEIRGGVRTVRIIKRSRKYGASFVLLAVGDGGKGEALRVSAHPESRSPVIALCIHYGEEDWNGLKPEHNMLQLPQDSRFRTPERRLKLVEAHHGDYRFQNEQNRHLFTLMRLLSDHTKNAAERRQDFQRYLETHVIDKETLGIIDAVTGRTAEETDGDAAPMFRPWSVWSQG